MKLFEYMQPSVFKSLEPSQQRFISKIVMKEVEEVSEERNITKEEAYNCIAKGLYTGDREI